MTAMPVPLEFGLPGPGWEPAPVEDAEALGVLFLAFGPGERSWFRPNLTISGGAVPAGGVDLDALADDAGQHLAETVGDVQLLSREAGDGPDPGLTQLLSWSVGESDDTHPITQLQTFLALVNESTGDAAAVYSFAMAAPAEDFADLVPDYQHFLGSVRPAGPDSVPS